MRRFLPFLILLTSVLVGTPRTGAQEPNRAGLFIEYGDGHIETQCVTFNEPEISGYDLLQTAGVPLTYDVGSGGTLCSIRDVGCAFPADRCFCQCATIGGDCTYWSFHTLQPEGQWAYSQLGAQRVRARPGDVHGWRWGRGEASNSASPSPTSFEQICAAPAAATTASATTASPEPTRAATRTSAPGSLNTAAPTPVMAAPSATRVPTPTMAPPLDPAVSNSAGRYLIFGALALLLGGGILWSRREA